MKKNLMIITAIALVGTATVTLNNLQAQPTPGAPPTAQVPPPQNPRPGMPPGMRQRPGSNSYRTAAMMLKRAKMELERSTDDYDGHRQTAIDACDKAAKELDAIQAIVVAKANAAKAAAAQAAQTPPPATAPAPAPAPVPAPSQ